MLEMLQTCFKNVPNKCRNATDSSKKLAIAAINYMRNHVRLTFSSFKTEPNQICTPSNGIK
jgi:hypothetical protein